MSRESLATLIDEVASSRPSLLPVLMGVLEDSRRASAITSELSRLIAECGTERSSRPCHDAFKAQADFEALMKADAWTDPSQVVPDPHLPSLIRLCRSYLKRGKKGRERLALKTALEKIERARERERRHGPEIEERYEWLKKWLP